jgi:mRNA interferase MazF
MTVNRGDVVLLNYPFSSGRGAKVRPAVVVQSDKNNSRLTNTIVAMITRTTQRAQHEPTQYLLDPSTPEGNAAGVLHPSAITCENLLTVEQQLIFRKIGSLSAAAMQQVDNCLKVALQLS